MKKLLVIVTTLLLTGCFNNPEKKLNEALENMRELDTYVHRTDALLTGSIEGESFKEEGYEIIKLDLIKDEYQLQYKEQFEDDRKDYIHKEDDIYYYIEHNYKDEYKKEVYDITKLSLFYFENDLYAEYDYEDESYNYSVSINDFKEINTSEVLDDFEGDTIDFSITLKDEYVYQIKYEVEVMGYKTAVTHTFSNFNEDMNIDIPEVFMVEELSKAELDYFNGTSFFNSKTPSINMANKFATNFYNDVKEIDLSEIFYDGIRLEASVVSYDEKQAYLKEHQPYRDELVAPLKKFTSKEMDDILVKYIGLKADETDKINFDFLNYLEEYDAYYVERTDTHYIHEVEFSSGTKQGDMIVLDHNYTCTAELILKQVGETYQFISNKCKET